MCGRYQLKFMPKESREIAEKAGEKGVAKA
ncbi:hypothetical protein C5S53_17445 [Methanophagales archaeon]|nr:hypothetical protein C5S53_17445 [Methanophagales archaeon]